MKKDGYAKVFFSQNHRFADVINGGFCGGRQMVRPEDLQELDSEDHRGLRRDLIRKTAFGTNFVLIGLENQDTVNYRLPLQIMRYEVGEYEKQAKQIERMVRDTRDASQKLTGGEYLYGFRKNSRLRPVVTLVLYYGKDPWDASGDLHGILDFSGLPEEIRDSVQNFQTTVLEVQSLRDTSVFQTDVKQVFDFIRCSNDKARLLDLVRSDPAYTRMESDAYDLAAAYTNTYGILQRKSYYMEEGQVDMCKAIDDMIEDGRNEGRAEGRKEGREEMLSEFAVSLKNLMEHFSISPKEAMAVMGMSDTMRSGLENRL